MLLEFKVVLLGSGCQRCPYSKVLFKLEVVLRVVLLTSLVLLRFEEIVLMYQQQLLFKFIPFRLIVEVVAYLYFVLEFKIQVASEFDLKV